MHWYSFWLATSRTIDWAKVGLPSLSTESMMPVICQNRIETTGIFYCKITGWSSKPNPSSQRCSQHSFPRWEEMTLFLLLSSTVKASLRPPKSRIHARKEQTRRTAVKKYSFGKQTSQVVGTDSTESSFLPLHSWHLTQTPQLPQTRRRQSQTLGASQSSCHRWPSRSTAPVGLQMHLWDPVRSDPIRGSLHRSYGGCPRSPGCCFWSSGPSVLSRPLLVLRESSP